jgi:hypothetical protein
MKTHVFHIYQNQDLEERKRKSKEDLLSCRNVGSRSLVIRRETQSKMKIKRCQKCKKQNTLVDISSEPQQINPSTVRSWVGKQCSSCGHTEKEYTFKEVVEEKG